MIGFVRLAIFGFIGMTAAYLLLSVYSRSVERERLEKEWDGDPANGDDPDARDAYIEAGLADYRRSLRRKLIWLVYVTPTLVVLTLLYLNDT